MTATHPAGRFGHIDVDGAIVKNFREKAHCDRSVINGGFFVLSQKVFDYIKNDASSWEEDSLPSLACDGQLRAFRHDGFWHPMDTLRDKQQLEDLWKSGEAPWKVWGESSDA